MSGTGRRGEGTKKTIFLHEPFWLYEMLFENQKGTFMTIRSRKPNPSSVTPAKAGVSGSGARDASLRWHDGNERDGHEKAEIPAGPPISMSKLLPGLRVRHDGWTQARTQRFLDTLAHTGCVTDAARVAGMSDVGARRLYKRFPAFAAAWDDALARAQKGLVAIAYQRAVEGKETIIYRRGEEYERRISPSDAMLGLLVKRGDLAGDGGRAIDPDATLTFAEQRDGWVFNVAGKKVKGQRPDDLAAKVEAKLHDMRIRYKENELAQNSCGTCGGPLSPERRAVQEASLERHFPRDPVTGRRAYRP